MSNVPSLASWLLRDFVSHLACTSGTGWLVLGEALIWDSTAGGPDDQSPPSQRLVAVDLEGCADMVSALQGLLVCVGEGDLRSDAVFLTRALSALPRSDELLLVKVIGYEEESQKQAARARWGPLIGWALWRWLSMRVPACAGLAELAGVARDGAKAREAGGSSDDAAFIDALVSVVRGVGLRASPELCAGAGQDFAFTGVRVELSHWSPLPDVILELQDGVIASASIETIGSEAVEPTAATDIGVSVARGSLGGEFPCDSLSNSDRSRSVFTLSVDATPGVDIIALPAISLSLVSYSVTWIVDVGAGESPIGAVALKLDMVLEARLLPFLTASGDETSSDGTINLSLLWSPVTGLLLDGSAALEKDLPVRQARLGPLAIQSAKIALEADLDTGVGLDLRVVAGFAMGPLEAVASGMGLSFGLKWPGEGGNLGPVDLRLEPVRPERIAVGFRTAVVEISGVLDLKADDQFQAALQIRVARVSVSAMGMLSTHTGPHKDQWDLIAAFDVTFSPGLPLGFGLRLTGVGGLLCVRRTVAPAELRSGVRDGTLSPVLFPGNLATDFEKLVSQADRFFPRRSGSAVLCPMVTICWGTSGLLTLEAGVLLTLPVAGRVSVVGTLRSEFPRRKGNKAPLVQLCAVFLATLDWAAKLFSLDASLNGSSLFGVPISGDVAVRIGWGDRPALAISAGGFHPDFALPPALVELSAMRRFGLNIGAQGFKLAVQAYLAVTSSSVQLGARGLLSASRGKLSLKAELRFDALVQLAPFSLSLALSVSAEIKYGDVHLLAVRLGVALTGPAPWRVLASGRIKVLGFKTSFSLETTFGKAQAIERATSRTVREQLVAALEAPGAWMDEGRDSEAPVVFAERADDVLRLRPDGRAVFRQGVVPLGEKITRFGGVPLSKSVTATIRASGALGQGVPVEDDFAPVQFFSVSREKQLEGQPFRRMACGVAFDDLGWDAGAEGVWSTVSLGAQRLILTPEAGEGGGRS